MSSVTYLSTQLDKMLRFMRNPKKKSNSIPCIRALQVQQQVRVSDDFKKGKGWNIYGKDSFKDVLKWKYDISMAMA